MNQAEGAAGGSSVDTQRHRTVSSSVLVARRIVRRRDNVRALPDSVIPPARRSTKIGNESPNLATSARSPYLTAGMLCPIPADPRSVVRAVVVNIVEEFDEQIYLFRGQDVLIGRHIANPLNDPHRHLFCSHA
jgi:hypothetical protein